MSTANQNLSITFKIHIYVFTHVNYLATCICRRKRREISRTGLPLVWSAKMVSYKYFLLHLMLISRGLLCYIFFFCCKFLLPKTLFHSCHLFYRSSLFRVLFTAIPFCSLSSFLRILFVSCPLFYRSSLFNVLFSTDQPCLMSSFLKIIFSKDHLSFWFS